MRDTAEVRQRKDQFFGTFDSAVSSLLTTVERAYLEVIITNFFVPSYFIKKFNSSLRCVLENV